MHRLWGQAKPAVSLTNSLEKPKQNQRADCRGTNQGHQQQNKLQSIVHNARRFSGSGELAEIIPGHNAQRRIGGNRPAATYRPTLLIGARWRRRATNLTASRTMVSPQVWSGTTDDDAVVVALKFVATEEKGHGECNPTFVGAHSSADCSARERHDDAVQCLNCGHRLCSRRQSAPSPRSLRQPAS